MNVHHRRRVLGPWRLVAVIVGAAALVAGSTAAAPADSAPGLSFHPLASTRVLDTRNGVGVAVVGPLGAGASIDLIIPGLPADAVAVAVNVTVANGTDASFLTLWPAGTARPGTSTINWASTAATGNAATVQLGDTGAISIYNDRGAVDTIVDLLGYYAPGGTAATPGPKGDPGPAGDRGATGEQGVAGADGADGADGMGIEGPAGTEGPMGPAGSDGVGAGPVGFVYLSAVNRTAQIIHRAGAGNAVTFDSLVVAAGGLSMTPGDAGITVLTDGVYKISFSVLANEANQLDVRVNGVQPGGAMVFAAVEGAANAGTVVLPLLSGDVVTLENWTSTGAPIADDPLVVGDVSLATSVGGTAANVNAWIVVEQLNAGSAI